MYAHWMQDIQQQAKQSEENIGESMKKYSGRKGMEQPCIEVGDLLMLNWRNICTKRPSTKQSPKRDGPLKVSKKKGSQANKCHKS